MSSIVTPEHWHETLGNMPMPEGANSDMLWAAQDSFRAMESTEETLAKIKVFEELEALYTKRGDARGYLPLINKVIELYREQLNG